MEYIMHLTLLLGLLILFMVHTANARNFKFFLSNSKTSDDISTEKDSFLPRKRPFKSIQDQLAQLSLLNGDKTATKFRPSFDAFKQLPPDFISNGQVQLTGIPMALPPMEVTAPPLVAAPQIANKFKPTFEALKQLPSNFIGNGQIQLTALPVTLPPTEATALPMTAPPVTAAPGILPVTVPPVQTTPQPIKEVPETASPVTTVPMQLTTVSAATTTMAPVTAAPVQTTTQPVTVAPVQIITHPITAAPVTATPSTAAPGRPWVTCRPDIHSANWVSIPEGGCVSTDEIESVCEKSFPIFEISGSTKDCVAFDGNWCCYGKK